MQNNLFLQIFKKYFDCFLPELREYNYNVWTKVMIIYKLAIPILYFAIYSYYYHDMCVLYQLEGLSNFLLLIVGLENGIAAFAWLISEGLSVYSLGLSVLQFFIMHHNEMIGCSTGKSTLLYIFVEFNEMLFMFSAGVNLRIMVPALVLIFFFCLITCSFGSFLKLFRRELPPEQIPDTELEWEEQKVDSEIECSICLDLLKVKDQVTKLSCQHQFHYQCLKKWLKEKHTCPNCRQQMK